MSIVVEPTICTRGADGESRAMSLISSLFASRIIALDAEVTAPVCSRLIQELLELEHQDPSAPVTLLISSPGGDVYAGLGLVSAMGAVSCPVTTVACGLVASMASVILACGDRRLAYENSFVMMHQITTGVGMAQQTDVGIIARQAEALRGKLDEILASRCALSREQVHEHTERDCWLTAHEALEVGLVDEVIPFANKCTAQAVV